MQFLAFLTKNSSRNVDCKIRGHWGQQRPTGDLIDHSGINSQPSLNIICNQIKICAIFSVCHSQITCYSLHPYTLYCHFSHALRKWTILKSKGVLYPLIFRLPWENKSLVGGYFGLISSKEKSPTSKIFAYFVMIPVKYLSKTFDETLMP